MGGAEGHCISIANTAVHFIVRNCYLAGANQTGYAGVRLWNVTNGQVTDNICTGNRYGILLQAGCTRNILSMNILTANRKAILLEEAAGNSLCWNIINNDCSSRP